MKSTTKFWLVPYQMMPELFARSLTFAFVGFLLLAGFAMVFVRSTLRQTRTKLTRPRS